MRRCEVGQLGPRKGEQRPCSRSRPACRPAGRPRSAPAPDRSRRSARRRRRHRGDRPARRLSVRSAPAGTVGGRGRSMSATAMPTSSRRIPVRAGDVVLTCRPASSAESAPRRHVAAAARGPRLHRRTQACGSDWPDEVHPSSKLQGACTAREGSTVGLARARRADQVVERSPAARRPARSPSATNTTAGRGTLL